MANRASAGRGIDTVVSTAHRSALAELLCFAQPLGQIQQRLKEFPFDYTGNPVVLRKAHLTSALHRCIKGEITTEDLENWAELLVVRPGIGYETGSESKLEAVLFQISTPQINAPLSATTCWRLLQELQ